MALQRLVDETEQHTLEVAKGLARKLPPYLRAVAHSVMDSPVAWEWKHFWVENAILWHTQSIATKKLGNLGQIWGKTEDDLFEGWNRSEYAQGFMTQMGKKQDLKAASLFCLAQLEQQLMALAQKHLGVKTKGRFTYKPQFELGDFPQASVRLYLGLDETKSVELLSWDRKHAEGQLQRIERALSLIKTHSPDSFTRFKHFTRRIVPIKQKEMVSDPLQTLPGHSFIDRYHRDEIDLLDDLLHENGHHQLNLHLIQGELLREDPDQIYYSPWRRTLRPIRGIYHAHYTFFYALALFYDLSRSLLEDRLSWPSPLTEEQKQKILYRFCEEWMMLDFTAADLVRARRRGQISVKGWKVVKDVESKRKPMKAMVKLARAKLSKDNLESLGNLALILQTQEKLTRGGR